MELHILGIKLMNVVLLHLLVMHCQKIVPNKKVIEVYYA